MSTTKKEDVIIGDIRELTGLPVQTAGEKTPTPLEEKRAETIQKLQETFTPDTEVTFVDEEDGKASEGAAPKKEVKSTVEVKDADTLIDDKGAKNTLDYTQKIKTLIADGLYEDFEVEDGVSFADSDLSLTEDQYKDIVAKQKLWKEEKAQEEVLGKLTPEEKEFITFKKNGGDLNTYLQTFAFKQKATDLEITTDQGKKAAIFAYYKNFVGWEEEKVMKYIANCEKNLELDEEAASAKAHIVNVAAAEHEDLIKEQAAKGEKIKENEKAYKKAIDGTLKKLNVEPKQAVTILKAFTQKDEQGYADIDKYYLSLKNDPEKIVLLYNMLSNPEDFLKSTAKQVASDTKLREIRKLKISAKAAENGAGAGEEKGETSSLKKIFF